MDRSKLWLSASRLLVRMAALLVFAGLIARAQTPATVPAPKNSSPSQAAAQRKEAAVQARQAAAQKRQAAAQARQTASQNRTAARTQPKTQAASKAATPATKTATTPPAANSGNSLLPSASPAQPRSAAQSSGSGAIGKGTLAWATRVYSSTGCIHNGNSAMCTFTFVNQGNEANLLAGGAGELSGIQLVDDAHVPHRWSSAYFMDKYGAQQRRLVVQPGDSGTYVVVFPNVDSRVDSAEFHLRTQIIGGITFSATGSADATANSDAAAESTSPSSTPADNIASRVNSAVTKAGPAAKNGNNAKK